MLLWSSTYRYPRSRLIRLAALLAVLLALFESFSYLHSTPFPRLLPNLLPTSDDGKTTPNDVASPSLPPIYSKTPYIPDVCQRKYGVRYIQDFLHTKRPYCETTKSASQISCFQTDVAEGRIDLFCTASGVILLSDSEKYEIDCQLRDWDNSTDLQGAPKIEEFREDWYSTGPGYLFQNFINVGKDHTSTVEECRTANASASHTILIKRESNHNLWHSLMEIFSYTLTMDILSLSTDETGKPLFDAHDAETSEVIILDDGDPGPFFELWNLIVKRPVRRRIDLKSAELSCLTNLIVPLSGATNLMWLGDWVPIECKESKTFSVFIERVMDFYDISQQRDLSEPLILTFVDRKGTRRLHNQDDLLSTLRSNYPDITINVVDFATINLREQIRIVANTDILAGVHGAGLTHAMFLPEGSALVEIQPMDVFHKGFRNVAALRGLRYFTTHALQNPTEESEEGNTDWHFRNIFIEEPRFIGLMEVAIKSMYHRGTLDIDVQ